VVGFTLVELLVVLAIIAALAAILLPVFARVREKGRQVVCVSHVRQLGQALLMYASDHNDMLVPGALVYPATAGTPPGDWYNVLQPYIRNADILRCPTKPSADLIAYGWNYQNFGYYYGRHGRGWCTVKGDVLAPAETIIIGDNEDLQARQIANIRYLYASAGTQRYRAARHSGGGLYVYLDGHAKHHRRDWLQDHLGLFTINASD